VLQRFAVEAVRIHQAVPERVEALDPILFGHLGSLAEQRGTRGGRLHALEVIDTVA
jgi:hypothetical protein